MKKLFIFILVIGSITGFAQSITPEMIADLNFVIQTAISPKGTDVAYLVRMPAGDGSGTYRSALMTVTRVGGSPKEVLGKEYNVASVSWRKDGKGLYFLMKDSTSKTVQLHSYDFGTRMISKLTSENRSISQYQIAPNGKALAYLMHDDKTNEEKENDKMKKDWIVYDKNEKHTRLYVTSFPVTENAKEVCDKALTVSHYVWSPDSKVIYFIAADRPSVDWTMMYQNVYRVDATGGSPRAVCRTEGKLGAIDVSPDGKMLAFCGAVDISDPLAQSVFTVPVEGVDATNQTKGYEGSAQDIKWIDKNTVLMLAAEGCYSSIKKINVSKGKMANVYNKGAIIRSMDLSMSTGNMSFVASSPDNSYEVYTGSTSGGLIKRTEHNPELKKIKLAKQEVIKWIGPDGFNVEGILTYPLDYKSGTAYPLVLQIHGGPEGVSQNGWNTRGVYPVQLIAANGYFVLEPNYRGSQGRGVEYAKADHKDLGGSEYGDVLAGIDYLVNKGMVDNDLVGTGGFSYGGYFSAWGGTKHSDRFKAAVMGAGISNWISFSGTTEIIHENSLVHWNLWWPEHMELVWERSPLAHINNAKTPMLIVHGGADTRVPLGQSEEMYNALKLKNVDTELVVYQRQPHGIIEREAQIDYMNRVVNWFNKYIK